MKKRMLTFIALLLAAIVVYGGSGVNIYFYCCNDCQSEGTNAVIEHKCCEIHHHHHLGEAITHYDEHTCDSYVQESHDACGVNRIHFDWQSLQNQLQLQPYFLYLDHSIFLPMDEKTLILADCIGIPLIHRTQKPPNLSKDDYFSLLTTLII